MADPDLPLDRLAQKALALWDLPAGARARRINVSENTTDLVEDEGGFRAVQRVHRANYHTRQAIEGALAWIGSHGGAPEPQAMAPHFAADTARLAQTWLARIGAQGRGV